MLVLFISNFVSAGFFGNLVGKITGNAVEDCDGCFVDGKCIPSSFRVVVNEVPNYCDYGNVLKSQQEINSVCQNDFECKSNRCIDGKCFDVKGEIKEVEEIAGLGLKVFCGVSTFFNRKRNNKLKNSEFE